MEKELLCFDVDGTLRDENHQVKDEIIETLKLLKNKGHKLIISTGRGLDSLHRTQIFDIFKWDGYVLNNGQLVIDKDEQIIEKNVMNKESVIKTIEIANSLNLAVTLKKDERIITKKPDEYVYATQKYFGNVIPKVGEYNGEDEVYAMCIFGPKGYSYDQFKNIEGVHIAPGMSCYADATIANVSKASGNNIFVNKFKTNGYIAFGDSQNDLEMFKHAKISICMKNGDIKAKEKADYILDIKEACIKLGLVKEEEYEY